MRTPLNGKYLGNFAFIIFSKKKNMSKTICYSTNPDPEVIGNINPTPQVNNLGNKNDVNNHKIDPSIIEKGLKSLDNSVLRGSYTLFLSNDKMDCLDNIAKEAFIEITSYGLSELSQHSPQNKTIHLETDKGGIQHKKPGVYVIQHKEKGKCVVGQTINLKNRFNQYISRANRETIEGGDNINKAYFNDIKEYKKLNLNASQIIQRYVVFTWVDENKASLNINDLKIKNEMNYLEHRLILAFYECGLAYNVEDVGPQINESTKLEIPINNEITNNEESYNNTDTSEYSSYEDTSPGTELQQKRIGEPPKPFKMENLYFECMEDYNTYLISQGKSRKNNTRIRKKLIANNNNLDSDSRYLTQSEIQEIRSSGRFIKVERL